jgi:hypothetical protein
VFRLLWSFNNLKGSFKKKKLNWGGGMNQEVECLPSKHETLSSNPSTAKKKRKD